MADKNDILKALAMGMRAYGNGGKVDPYQEMSTQLALQQKQFELDQKRKAAQQQAPIDERSAAMRDQFFSWLQTQMQQTGQVPQVNPTGAAPTGPTVHTMQPIQSPQQQMAQQAQQFQPQNQKQDQLFKNQVLSSLSIDDNKISIGLKQDPEFLKEMETMFDVKKAASVEDAKNASEAGVNFSKAISQFGALVSNIKAKDSEQGGLGLAEGIAGGIRATLRMPNTGAISAFPGQVTESAIALNKILTGQNRVIKGVLKQIQGTLPGPRDTAEQVSSKLSQSIENSFKITRALQRGDIVLKELNEFMDYTDSNGTSQSLPTGSYVDKNGKEVDLDKLVTKFDLSKTEKAFLDKLKTKIITDTEPLKSTPLYKDKNTLTVDNVFDGLI